MTSLYKECLKSWQVHMPGFEVIEWNEQNIDTNNTFVKFCIENKRWAFLSDYIRMIALRDHGGIYLDVDMEAVRSLEPLLDYQCFLGYEDEARLNTAVIGGVKGHHFFDNAIGIIEQRHHDKKPFLIAPEVANECVEINADNIELMPWHCFYPFNPYAKAHDRKQLMYSYIEQDTYLIHHWGKGWKMGFLEKVKRKLMK